MGVFAGNVHGNAPADERIRLMSDALAARDVGDMERAKDKLVQLLEYSPDDEGLQRLLANVERNIQPALDDTAFEVEGDELTASGLSESQRRELETVIDDVKAYRGLAKDQSKNNEHSNAVETLRLARAELPRNAATQDLHMQLEKDQSEALLAFIQYQLDQGDLDGARESLASYAEVAPESRRTSRVTRDLERELVSPARLPIEEASPGFVEDQEEIRRMVRVGRAQFLNGDLLGAENTFRQVEAMDVYNSEAKAMLARIAEEKSRRNHLDRSKTRKQMLEEIGASWQRPQIYVDRRPDAPDEVEELPLERKLGEIRIPSVNFAGVELRRAISTLSQVSAEYDPDGVGVNIVTMGMDRDGDEPLVHINVRDLSLKRVLDLIVDSVTFRYEVEEDAVVVRPGVRRRPDLETENFPVSASTIQRMMGRAAPSDAGGGSDDPFASPTPAPEDAGNGASSSGLRDFLQQAAGVDFTVQGSSLIYDGTDVWVTQTPRNLERIRNVFRRLTDVRQVEIEARFLEVSESAVDELGFDWNVVSPGGNVQYQTQNRNLAGASAGQQSAANEIRIGDLSFPVTPPTIPGGPALGSGATSVATIDGSVDGFDVRAAVRALSQRTGSDLLSAPKLTVLSGHQANINVAQEIRYPDSFGDTQSDVGRGGTGEAGSAGVTITPGTPQDFQMRRVGVELTVTPTVEQDNSVTLDLNPSVTEFEGFVEFGGVSLAISGGEVVTTPSGFFQPIFATREVNTKVNIWDGATVVMGGLTREEVRRVEDKLPVLGDIPVLGRFFRSEGEGSQKRNLLIFVTANLVSPGGSPMRQQLRDVEPGALFQNPTLVMPSGAISRERREE